MESTGTIFDNATDVFEQVKYCFVTELQAWYWNIQLEDHQLSQIHT